MVWMFIAYGNRWSQLSNISRESDPNAIKMAIEAYSVALSRIEKV